MLFIKYHVCIKSNRIQYDDMMEHLDQVRLDDLIQSFMWLNEIRNNIQLHY